MSTVELDERTMANMEVALARACSQIPEMGELHEARSYIAQKILGCVSSGDKTLQGMTQVATRAARELKDERALNHAK
jgi:hypothetical protein